jgi:hypothetical protein
MKKIIIFLLVVFSLTACSNYGKKVTLEGSKGEVYYKGDGVTEADANKLCKYLKDDINYFSADRKSSVQLMKSKEDGYDIRFVVDEEKLKASPESADAFVQIGAAMSIDLYNNKPVNVILTDDQFKKVIRTLPFDKEAVKKLMEKANPAVIEETAIPEDTKSDDKQE